MALKALLARKAVKTTAKHSARGAAGKLKREPIRATALLAAGAVIGAAAVWLLGRLGSRGAGGGPVGSGHWPDAGGSV